MGKVTTACNPCAVRKIKCNGARPCPPCMKSGLACAYSVHSKRGPKGPRPATRARIDKSIQLRQQDSYSSDVHYLEHGETESSLATSLASPMAASVSGETKRPSLDSACSLSYASNGSTTTMTVTLGDSDVTLDEVATYIHLYEKSLYPVWPVVDGPMLLHRLRVEPCDPETCALTFALCAAVTARLRIDNPQDPPNTAPELTTSSRFAELADVHRSMYSYRARAALTSILIPFFLHVHYDCRCRVFMDSLLLREAISVAQLMNLDKASGYTDDVSPHAQAHRRKIFWLLFISEKGCAMMRDFPTSLQPGLPFPDPNDEPNPNLIIAFISLVKLFAAVNDVFGVNGSGLVSLKPDSAGISRKSPSEFFTNLQHELGRPPELGQQTHDMQRADILLTQQWLQVLVWRFSVSHVDMSAEDNEEALSFTFPAKIARQTLECLRNLPFEAIVAHGRGMEQKIFEIACTLLDIINVVPPTTMQMVPAMLPDIGIASTHTGRPHSTCPNAESTLSLLQSLSSILSIIGGRHSPYIGLLQKKIAESPVLLTSQALEVSPNDQSRPSPRILSVADTHDAHHGVNSTVAHEDGEMNKQPGFMHNDFASASNHLQSTGHSGTENGSWTTAGPHDYHYNTAFMELALDSVPQYSHAYLKAPLPNEGGHWPIGTEVLGTISELSYLDGWRGVSQGYSRTQRRQDDDLAAGVSRE